MDVHEAFIAAQRSAERLGELLPVLAQRPLVGQREGATAHVEAYLGEVQVKMVEARARHDLAALKRLQNDTDELRATILRLLQRSNEGASA